MTEVGAQHTFRWHGHTLGYEEHGRGERLLVYANGLLMDAEMNRALAADLARRGHRVVLLDLLGHGRSDKPTHAAEYRMDLYADQIVACLDHLGATDAVVGGVSLGANASLYASLRAEDRVRALLLEMPVLEWAVPAAALVFTPLVLALHYARAPFALLGRLAGRAPATPIDALNSALRGLSTPPDTMAAVLHGLLVGPVAPSADERREITVPALVVGHPRDLIHPFNDAANLEAQLPRGELALAGSVLELRLRPERLTGRIATFLDEVWAHARVEGAPPLEATGA